MWAGLSHARICSARVWQPGLHTQSSCPDTALHAALSLEQTPAHVSAHLTDCGGAHTHLFLSLSSLSSHISRPLTCAPSFPTPPSAHLSAWHNILSHPLTCLSARLPPSFSRAFPRFSQAVSALERATTLDPADALAAEQLAQARDDVEKQRQKLPTSREAQEEDEEERAKRDKFVTKRAGNFRSVLALSLVVR